jgi:hypothetical protein
VARIRQLYAVEDEAKNFDAAARAALRQEKSKPLLDALKDWLDREQRLAIPKTPIAEALTYALNQWATLTVYLTDGDLAIDNNAAEGHQAVRDRPQKLDLLRLRPRWPGARHARQLHCHLPTGQDQPLDLAPRHAHPPAHHLCQSTSNLASRHTELTPPPLRPRPIPSVCFTERTRRFRRNESDHDRVVLDLDIGALQTAIVGQKLPQ